MPWIELVAERRQKQLPPGMQPPEGAADWYKIHNSAEDAESTDVYVYNDIGGWFGIYSDEFIDEFKQIATKNINLRLNSPGGSVFEGIAIANAIRSHPANVTVYVDSLAASIASVIALAGNKVIMMPQSQFMVHNASGACYGEAGDMTKMADLLDHQTRNIAEAYADRTGRPVAEWLDLMSAETWFTAREAVEMGLADEVYTASTPAPPKETVPAAKLAKSWDLAAMFRYAGRDNAPAPVLNKAVVPDVKNVMRQFDEGDKVAALVKHEPEHTVGRIAVVNGNAYGVIWENPDDDTAENNTEVYRWYVDDELQWLEGGADHDENEAAEEEPTESDLLPGVSHPNGLPLPPHASAGNAQLTIKVGDLVSAELLRALAAMAVDAALTVLEGTACPSHSTSVKAGAWDAGANEGHLPSPVPLATVKEMYAYYDEEKVEDGAVPKGSCKLPHHFVSADGTPGAASINGVRNALARLPQTQGLSDQERSAAEAHLRKHLNAFSGDEEDHVHDETTDHVHDEVEDAAKKKTPPPPPDEDDDNPDEDDDNGDGGDSDGDDDDTSDKAPSASADDWLGVVAHLTAPSPSADDVFNSLKEAW